MEPGRRATGSTAEQRAWHVYDFGQERRVGFVAFLGAAATVAMFSPRDGRSGVVIYQSFLPEIAPGEDRDQVSSRGWAAAWTSMMAVRISLASAGVWWAVFTVPPLLALYNRATARQVPAAGQNAIASVLRHLVHTRKKSEAITGAKRAVIVSLVT